MATSAYTLMGSEFPPLPRTLPLVRRLLEVEGLGSSAIARRLGIGLASVYRVLAGKGGSDPVTTGARST